MFRTLFVLVSLAALSQAGSLVLVEGDSDSYDAGWRDALDPVYCSSGYTIGIATSENWNIAEQAVILDPEYTDLDNYRIIFLSHDDGIDFAELLGDILFERKGVLLVRNEEGFPEAFTAPGVHFVQPLRFIEPSRELEIPSSDQSVDDYISDIVDAVSEVGIQGYTQHLQDYGTRYSSTDNFDTACNWVQAQFESHGLTAFQQTFPMSGYNCQNVIAELPGQIDSTKIFIICGHLDSISPYSSTDAPGADDNASGSAAVLEAARIMSGYDFSYTIRFICFGGEEQGLWGSEYYAGLAAAASEDIIGVVNLDMIYYGPSGHDVLWVPYNTQSTGLALAFEAISDTYVPALSVEIEYNPGITYSDHSPFWNEGYAALLGIEEQVFSNPYYHQTTDILSNYMMYFPFGTNCTRAALATVAYLAEPIGPTGISGQTSGVISTEPITASISPNPVRNSATIHLSRAVNSGASITLFDISGRIIESINLESTDPGSEFSIGTSGLPSGAYTVMISDETGPVTSTLLIKL